MNYSFNIGQIDMAIRPQYANFPKCQWTFLFQGIWMLHIQGEIRRQFITIHTCWKWNRNARFEQHLDSSLNMRLESYSSLFYKIWFQPKYRSIQLPFLIIVKKTHLRLITRANCVVRLFTLQQWRRSIDTFLFGDL
jgi:hypothetical protein